MDVTDPPLPQPQLSRPHLATPSGLATLDDRVSDRLLRDRILVLGQAVDDEVANRLCAELLLLAAEDPHRDISLYVNSPGGSVYAGLAVFDTMESIPCDVATYVFGLAASMGQFLLTAGAPGKRFALPRARVLMHQPSGGIGGTASDIAIQARQVRELKAEIARLTAERTGQSVETVTRDADRDRWFTARQALEYGFVDHVVDRVVDRVIHRAPGRATMTP